MNNIPSESSKLSSQITQGHYLISRTIDLLSVPVHSGDQVINFMMCCKHDRFPVLAFIQLAIAMQGEHKSFFAIQLLGKCCANGHTHTLAQRSTGDANAWQVLMCCRMSLQAAV